MNTQDRIQRAKELLVTVRHAAIATTNADGSPHNTPVFATFDKHLNFYWASHPGSVHSQNVTRDGRVFVVLFDSTRKGGGLYVQGVAAMVENDELDAALHIVNANRQRWGRSVVTNDTYKATQPQRLYKSTFKRAWVNAADRIANDQVLKDYRIEVTPQDLA